MALLEGVASVESGHYERVYCILVHVVSNTYMYNVIKKMGKYLKHCFL